MSDSNAYVNAYIENALAMIHDYINGILQLKAQIKVSESLIVEKDREIQNLTNQVSQTNQSNEELFRLRDHAQRLENENAGLSNKVSHMDTLLRQINDMKQEILSRDAQIANLDAKIVALTAIPEEETTTEPIVINRKKKTVKPVTKADDDF